ncbi:hypothetical protein OH738_29400 [Streptomyces hirsutus]|uniref:hypothetical protein n=1 Tax=Streptomyces hirsutus TaxID=35620 RepID=UPI0038641258|nr:hypothetical protein OH738_29400 [Streptomyces hirsutus]
MAETTQDTAAGEGTPTGYGYCSWHQRFAADVRLIDVIEQGSGPGHVHYACPPCRTAHGLVPYADR